jgi:hypothetical protein
LVFLVTEPSSCTYTGEQSELDAETEPGATSVFRGGTFAGDTPALLHLVAGHIRWGEDGGVGGDGDDTETKISDRSFRAVMDLNILMVIRNLPSGSAKTNERVGRQFDVAQLEAISKFVEGLVLNFDIKEFFLDVGHLDLGGDVGSAEVGLAGHKGE